MWKKYRAGLENLARIFFDNDYSRLGCIFCIYFISHFFTCNLTNTRHNLFGDNFSTNFEAKFITKHF